METVDRLCIKDFREEADNGVLELHAGKRYHTLREGQYPAIFPDLAKWPIPEGVPHVVVLTNFWAWVPLSIFKPE